MTSIVEKQAGIVKDFNRFSGWEGRYQHIIQLGKKLKPLADAHKTEENRVKGCQSMTWLYAYLDQDKLVYEADSDAFIVRGIAAMLVSVYSGHRPEEILQAGTGFLNAIGLTQHLSQSRANGLAAMVRQFKNYAIAFQTLLRQSKT